MITCAIVIVAVRTSIRHSLLDLCYLSYTESERSNVKLRLGFLASHGGSSMQAIHKAIQAGKLNAEACVLISNNSQSRAAAFAKENSIPTYHLSLKTAHPPELLDRAILDTLIAHDVQFVILSGYMKKLGPQTLSTYKNRILNIHPALLPKFGGQGMYGNHIHEAVLVAKEKMTGITIHLVDEFYDHGTIIAQCQVPVLETDTAESLATRVKERERRFFVEVLQQLSQNHRKEVVRVWQETLKHEQ